VEGVSLLASLFVVDLRHSLLRGGGAYLHGFTPWKQLSFPPSTTEEITTSSALYLVRTSHKRLNV